MPPRSRPQSIEDFGEVLQPDEAQEPILARPVRNALTDWLTEIWADEELAAVDLKPRKKALFDGPPGVGKTTLAHHLAARLGLPMLVVLPDRIMTTYISESAGALGNLFDVLAESEEQHLVFFDEFESIAQKRMSGGLNPVGEADHNHMVNTLLNRLQKHDGFVIAATNRGKEIDSAVWRRFQIQITLETPGQFERERILALYLKPYGLPSGPLKKLAQAFATAAPSLIREWCEGLKRQLVVGPKANWNMQREAVIERLIASIQPHPDLGKPRLWSLGTKDDAVKAMPWPLPKAGEIEAEPPATVRAAGSNVVALKSVE